MEYAQNEIADLDRKEKEGIISEHKVSFVFKSDSGDSG
jgi:hypothetical protein